MLSLGKAKRNAAKICALVVLVATLPGCISMPDFDRSADIPPEFREDIDAIDGYPTAARLPSAPQQLREQGEWDDRASSVLDVKADLAMKASLPASTPDQIRARRAALLTKLYAFKLDDPS